MPLTPEQKNRMQLVFNSISAERSRQELLLSQGKFPWSCDDVFVSDIKKLGVLAEEFGEASKEAAQIQEQYDRVYQDDKKVIDASIAVAVTRRKALLREELIQVAAVAVAWCEAIDMQLSRNLIKSEVERERWMIDVAEKERVPRTLSVEEKVKVTLTIPEFKFDIGDRVQLIKGYPYIGKFARIMDRRVIGERKIYGVKLEGQSTFSDRWEDDLLKVEEKVKVQTLTIPKRNETITLPNQHVTCCACKKEEGIYDLLCIALSMHGSIIVHKSIEKLQSKNFMCACTHPEESSNSNLCMTCKGTIK